MGADLKYNMYMPTYTTAASGSLSSLLNFTTPRFPPHVLVRK